MPYIVNRKILAFVHIEKAAGTTLIKLFRRNFSIRFMEVRRLTAISDYFLTESDLEINEVGKKEY